MIYSEKIKIDNLNKIYVLHRYARYDMVLI